MTARVIDTAAGRMIARATPRGLARIDQVGPDQDLASWFTVTHPDDDEVCGPGPGAAAEHLDRVADQLEAYCAGRLREFDVPVDWAAAGVHDEFSREAYREIQHIPYGETSTYGQISVDAGRPRNARRVGRLCTLVPVPFVIPVHRVIRADGGMGNCPEYRLRLLEHERRNLAAAEPATFGRGANENGGS
ncbi:methylated-DNA--[protein]-cysteine S-methyltransferase [Dietzia sp. PP-33]|uniref:methylated-DNA--[protein]-cysteine S-methyltransferase n=1 Tax=Dietzia sp. PP-33 TaxID=2957500 RepID=UPI0029AC2D70|nr:methylated-DNA--[protein]-cysteine S-methyltransferase [Dietzia sp. PP-33]MDX2356178.1 methylated-DNA--[protein]-cysteine S-methyltransferase [Dietzia sp. PP-33]